MQPNGPSYYGQPMQQPPLNYNQPGGQLGEVRNPINWFLITLVTCGWGGLYWTYLMVLDIKNYTGNPELNPTMDILITYFTLGLWIPLRYGKEIQKMQIGVGMQAEDQGLMFWLLMMLCGYGYIKMQEEINKVWIARGAQPLS